MGQAMPSRTGKTTSQTAPNSAAAFALRGMEAAVAAALDGFIAVDEAGHIVLFNPVAERMFRATAAEAIGQPLSRFIPERYGLVGAEPGEFGGAVGLRTNGEEFPARGATARIEAGGVKLTAVHLRDMGRFKTNEEARHQLAREVDHRARNALAVVQALVSLTRAPTKDDFVAAVRGRVSALGRAHSLLAQNRWEGASFAQILAGEAAACQREGRVHVGGRAVTLSANAVQPVCMLVHELMTNAVRHGALSTDQGVVEASWRILADGTLDFAWAETGGPQVREPADTGFGSTLAREAVTRQLQGSLTVDWPAQGMRLHAVLPAQLYRLDRAPPRASGPAEAVPAQL
jgi:PAS domain S-box-containing protein